jgi:hypothetical protein
VALKTEQRRLLFSHGTPLTTQGVGTDGVQEWGEKESHGRSESSLIFCSRTCFTLTEGSQASPVRPSDKGSVKVKTL